MQKLKPVLRGGYRYLTGWGVALNGTLLWGKVLSVWLRATVGAGMITPAMAWLVTLLGLMLPLGVWAWWNVETAPEMPSKGELVYRWGIALIQVVGFVFGAMGG